MLPPPHSKPVCVRLCVCVCVCVCLCVCVCTCTAVALATAECALPFAELRRRWPIPANLNLALVATWASAAIGLLFLASSGGWSLAIAAAVAFSFVMQLGFSLVHEAEHDKLHPDRRVNDACGWLLAAMFPGSYAFMRGAHLLHHRRNRADAELVDYVRPSESATVKAVQYYALVCGLVWVGVPLISLAIALLPRGVVRLRPTTSSSAAEYLNALLALSPWRVRAEVGLAVAAEVGRAGELTSTNAACEVT